MHLWGLVVLIPLLQVPGLLLLSRYVDVGEELQWRPGYAHHVQKGETDRVPGQCRRCGAANAEEFSFCQNCAARLS